MTPKQVRIGKIVGCHGLRGDLKVRPASEDAAWVGRLKEVGLKTPDSPEPVDVQVLASHRQGPHVLVRLQGYEDRTRAEALVGAIVYADAAVLPTPGKDEYWVDDLIGMAVMDRETGRQRGIVKDVLSSAGSDFLEIQLEDSVETAVIPFIHKFFPHVDAENRLIEMDLLSDFLSFSDEPITPDRLKE